MRIDLKKIENVEDIQSILFESLCYFDDFCKKHKLKYFLANGTLLGAAKYSKFIPWDDDADILMPREDYDKLVKLKEINNMSYSLLCREQIAGWRMPYAKLSYTETLLIEGEYNFGAELGVSVDIFPIDKWSCIYSIAKFQAVISEIYKRLLVASIGSDFHTSKKGIKKYILFLIWFTGKKMGYENILTYIEKCIDNSKKNKNVYVGCRAWTCHKYKEVFHKEVFEKTKYLLLKGKSFPVPYEYEVYLDNLYGKWREELKPEDQHSNHDINVWWKDEQQIS